MDNEKKKEINNFSHNLKTFILVNDMTYEDFAKKLNLLLITNNHTGKTYYVGKDIRSFAYRSYPRDMVASVMISKIIGKEMSELVMTKFDEEELCLKDKKLSINKEVSDKMKKLLVQLNTEDYMLLMLLSAMSDKDEIDSFFCKVCDVGIFYNSGINVRSVLYVSDGRLPIKVTEWPWIDYGNRISKYGNNEILAIESELNDKYFQKLKDLGFVVDYYCGENGLSPNEFENPPDKVFSLNIILSLTDEEKLYFDTELHEILEARMQNI